MPQAASLWPPEPLLSAPEDRGHQARAAASMHNGMLSLWLARQAALLARSRAITSSPGTGFTLPLSRSS